MLAETWTFVTSSVAISSPATSPATPTGGTAPPRVSGEGWWTALKTNMIHPSHFQEVHQRDDPGNKQTDRAGQHAADMEGALRETRLPGEVSGKPVIRKHHDED